MMKRFLFLLMIATCMTAGSVSINAQNQSDAKRNLEVGSAYFIEGNFKKAIPLYSKALEQEKIKPTLDHDLWRVLVDNLGMAYGITGDLKRAKETFTYGLSKDENYPMFHYNMACTFAEMGDVDKSIEYLKSAFANKENMIAGEAMPDPAKDSSFKKFTKNEKFLNALKEIKQN